MPITVEWVNTSQVHHAMEYYTAMKKSELSLCAITRMNLPSEKNKKNRHKKA